MRSAQQIQHDAAALGSSINVSAGPVSTSLGGEVATKNIALFVSLLGDVVRHPLLDTGDSSAFGATRSARLDSTLQNPADRARQQWRSMVFPDQPFGHPYTHPTTLGALQLGHVRNVYDENYSAARISISAGVFDDVGVGNGGAVRVQRLEGWYARGGAKGIGRRAASVHAGRLAGCGAGVRSGRAYP